MKVIGIANGYVGQFEVLGNHGFKDQVFEQKMKHMGFDDGEAWCALFAELCFREAYPEHDAEFAKLFSEGAVKTLQQFAAAGYEVHTVPKLGSLMIMQQYKDNVKQWQGHAGIVVEVLSNSEWKSVEGNTNSGGSREGDSVQVKKRTLFHKASGLRVAGFVVIPKIK